MAKIKRRELIGMIAATFLLLITGYFLWTHYSKSGKQTVEATGTIEATTIELTAKVAGTIQKINVKAGTEVKQGDLVAAITRNDLVAQRDRDALNVAIAGNQLDELLAGARSQQIQEAQANVEIQQIGVEKAQKDLSRAEVLFSQGTISQTELENYQNSKQVALHQLEAAKANFSLLQAGGSSNQIKAAQNQVKMMQSVLKSSESLVADLKIYSPLAGTILSKNYEAGEYVTAGSSLATVADLKTVWINVFIPTDDLPSIKLGQNADFTIGGLEKVFTGKVSEIAGKGEFTPKTIQTKKERANIVFRVKIEADNSEGILKPGMPADVVF